MHSESSFGFSFVNGLDVTVDPRPAFSTARETVRFEIRTHVLRRRFLARPAPAIPATWRTPGAAEDTTIVDSEPYPQALGSVGFPARLTGRDLCLPLFR